jgi:hypothetical protein
VIAEIVAACITAGIDGREPDRTFPGARTVDAIHRSVLIRCPAVSDALSKALASGMAVEKAELVFDFRSTEVVPQGYISRPGLGESKWKADPPRWHLVGWGLRRAWIPDERLGPTFNAYIKDAGYWTRYGATDPATDRFATSLGPVELSAAQPIARLDVTASGERMITEGVLVEKLETYDFRYRDWNDPYEWAVATGGHGLTFGNVRIVVSLRTGVAANTNIPKEPDFPAYAESLRGSAEAGHATAVIPDEAHFASLAAQFDLREGSQALPRIRALAKVGGGTASDWMNALQSRDYNRYRKLIADILATPPRYWRGWSIHDDLLVWFVYRDMLPDFVKDHVRAYWESWLLPDIPTTQLFHPQGAENLDYWNQAHDWRGRTSFFRGGYNLSLSTQNFNNTAAVGALLGGEIAGSRHAIEDGEEGFERFPLRFWTFLDGSTQEMLDHYYFSITVSAQKLIADFGPTAFDRLMGRVALDRSIDLLASAYHPALRRVVGVSGRTNLQSVLVQQEGIQSVLHLISNNGTLLYPTQPLGATIGGMRVWGEDFPPGRAAVMATKSEWDAPWVAQIVDAKALPFEETATETTRGAFTPPLWRRTYLARHYGLASQDIKDGTVDIIAQWTCGKRAAESIDDLGTLTAGYVANGASLAATAGGVTTRAGSVATFQDRNRAIVFMKPHSERARILQSAGKDGVASLASVLAIWKTSGTNGLQIFVDEQAVVQLPARARAGQVIAIQDGVSYLGIVPLHGTDLGRSDEILIERGIAGHSEPNGALIAPVVTISSYNVRRPQALAPDDAAWDSITARSYGGFVIEMGEVEEDGSFEAFRRALRSRRLDESWNAKERVVQVAYDRARSMEVAFGTSYSQASPGMGAVPGEQKLVFPYRRVEGAWPYLAPGIERDSPLTQQGTTGRLEKAGAVLITEPGRKAWLRVSPDRKVFTAYNPLPDQTAWRFMVPGGITVQAVQRVGLLRVCIQPATSEVRIDTGWKANPAEGQMGGELVARGFRLRPRVILNGRELSADEVPLTADGYRIALLASSAR